MTGGTTALVLIDLQVALVDMDVEFEKRSS